MTLSRTCCLLFLLAVLARSLSGSVYSAKQGCRGDDILLFLNIRVDQDFTVLKLYVNGINYTEIGVWNIQKFVHNTTFLNGYENRISLDLYGNIWIRNLQDTDEGKYTIEVVTRNVTMKHNVELNVFVAPETHCKPKIIPGEDTMRTYLDQDGCGKPAATAYWLEQPGISIEGSTIKLIPGQDVGTVYACINSPALRCVNNVKLFDYCTPSKGKIQNKVTDVSTVTTATLVLICFVLAIIVGISIALYIYYRWLKDLLKKKATSQNNEDMLKKTATSQNDEDAKSLLDEHPTSPSGADSGRDSDTNRTS